MKACMLLVLAVLVGGCATRTPPIQAQTGAVPGDYFGDLVILGVSRRITETAQPNAIRPGQDIGYIEWLRDIPVPVGTVAIVPILSGWTLGFGYFNDDGTIHYNDRPLSHEWAGVEVDHISAPDFSTPSPSQKATLKITMMLSDYNGDDPWHGVVEFHVLYLGKPKSRADWRALLP